MVQLVRIFGPYPSDLGSSPESETKAEVCGWMVSHEKKCPTGWARMEKQSKISFDPGGGRKTLKIFELDV